MGTKLALFSSVISGFSAIASYKITSEYLNTLQSVKEQILYRTQEITRETVEKANQEAYNIVSQTNGNDLTYGLLMAGFAGLNGAISLYSLLDERRMREEKHTKN